MARARARALALAAAATAALGALPRPWVTDPVLDTLAGRLLSQQVVVSDAECATLNALVDLSLSTLNASCQFSDVDYTGENSAFWPASNHTVRMRAMAASVLSPRCGAYFNATTVALKASCALSWWLAADPGNPNWWYMDIGIPGYVAPTAMMLWDYLTADQVPQLLTILNRSHYAGYSGANLVWTAGNVVWRGVLTGNLSLTSAAAAAALSTITVAPGSAEGVKADGSFFQHGAQLYNGGYGQSFAYDVTNLLSLVAGTPLAATPTQIDTFSAFLLNGSLRMIFYAPAPFDGMGPPMWDVAVIGRDVSRPYGAFLQFGFGQSGQQVSFVTSALATIGGAHAGALQTYAAALNGTTVGPPALALGHRHYWVGDYTNMVTRTWMASLRMQSSRTLRCECVNVENAQGLHLADGALYVYKTGYEYAGVFPEWDWERVPGVTVKAGAVALGCATVQGPSNNSFTGGVSDGATGVSSQDFTAPLGAGLQLRRHVSFAGDVILVALGGVRSVGDDGHAVTTSVESARLGGDVWYGPLGADGAGKAGLLPPGDHTFPPGAGGGIGWVWHNGTGYVLHSVADGSGAAGVRVTVDPNATGAWGAIGQEAAFGNATVPLFSLWLEHPPGATAGGVPVVYTVVPGVDLGTFMAGAATGAAGAYGSAVMPAPTGPPAWVASLRSPAGPVALTVYPDPAGVNGSLPAPVTVVPGGALPGLTLTHAGAYLVRFDSAVVTVSVANPLQTPWAPSVAVAATAFRPAVGDGFTCGADGSVMFTGAPADGSSLTATCQLA